MTTQREVLATVLARLQATPALVDNRTDRIRLAHRTPVSREKTPAIHVVPLEVESSGNRGGDCVRRRLTFAVRIFGRSDGGVADIDALIVDVLARLKPAAADAIPYPAEVVMREPRRVRFEEDDADEDVAFAELELSADYTSAEWSI